MASIRKIEGKGGASYKITVSMGRDSQDKQIRHYKTWKPSKPMSSRQEEKEVRRAAYEFEREIMLGFQIDNRQTFDQYARYVIELKERQGAAQNTIAIYNLFMKKISPMIGHMKMVSIRPQHLNNLYRELEKTRKSNIRDKATPKVDFMALIAERGESRAGFARNCGLSDGTIKSLCNGKYIGRKSANKIAAYVGKPCERLFNIEENNAYLSQNTMGRIHSFISLVFHQAEMEMLIPYNPARKITPPHAKLHNPNYFQPEQIWAILEAADSEPVKWKAMIYLLALSGARRGEILALKWGNVDFENKTIKIESSLSFLPHIGTYEGPTKTRNIRYVPLPEEAFNVLRQHRAWQTEQQLLYGDMWEKSDYVFTRDKGGPLYPTAINSMLNRFTKAHNFPHINPHSFRHSAASIMIASGVDVVSVSKMLGHSTTRTTMEIYGHAIEEAKRNASECIAEAILRGKQA